MSDTTQKIKFSIKVFLSTCDQIHRKLRIWSHLLKKLSVENFICCAMWFTKQVLVVNYVTVYNWAEISQLMFTSNQVTGLCMIGRLAINGLSSVRKKTVSFLTDHVLNLNLQSGVHVIP